jgi:hypothetical protein
MKPLPVNEETLKLARRCVWYKPPEDTLRNPIHLASHVLAHGMRRDVAMLRAHIGDEGLIEALRNAPPGIMDARSWWYWHLVLLDESPPPPMPERTFGQS